MKEIPTVESIREAYRRIQPLVKATPVLTCRSINELVSSTLFFKCENFQKSGSFKFRGASHAISVLGKEDLRRGVATHSSGNHGGAVALCAAQRGIEAFIVMPENSRRVKVEAVKGYGAKITFCRPTLNAREESLNQILEQRGAHFIHPYNDLRIVEGQATAALELLQEIDRLDAVMAPVGGGGLLSGTALAVRYLSPATEIVGVEPAGADDAFRSFRDGVLYESINPRTVADGLLTSLGSHTFPIIRKCVHRIVTVDEPSILQSMRLIWERMKILIEPSSAVPLAAILSGKMNARGKRVGIILSGGNADLDRLPWQ